MVIVFVIVELKLIYLISFKKDGIFEDKVVGWNNIGKCFIIYCKMWVYIN